MTTRPRIGIALSVRLACLACLAVSVTVACNGVLGIPEVGHLEDEQADAAVQAEPTPEAQAPVTCSPGFKSCGGACVSILEPSTGCAAADCKPCALAHAKNTCIRGECAIEACEEGWLNCNSQRADGCEIDIKNDRNNCRQCGTKCGDFLCSNGICVCSDNDSCGYNGKCINKTCVCGSGNTCSLGSECDDYNSCDF